MSTFVPPRSEVLAVRRERRFSPGRVADDAAILEATAARLRRPDVGIGLVDGEALDAVPRGIRLVLAMCQGDRALAALDRARCLAVNAPEAIRSCFRVELVRRLDAAGLPQPAWRLAGPEMPRDLGPAPWLKRGDVHAMASGDVRRIADPGEWTRAVTSLLDQGVPRAIVQEHREGAVYKFYGVRRGFFRTFGLPQEHVPEAARLGEAGARALGLAVYGGDGVLAPDGSLSLIDFNDWPSFSRCRDEAAAAIAAYADALLAGAPVP